MPGWHRLLAAAAALGALTLVAAPAVAQPLVDAAGNRLVLDTSACHGELCVLADEVRFRQVVLNLVSNANKFTTAGEITVTVARLGPWCHVEVRDTGIGMNTDQTSRIFEPFVQADTSTTKRYGGTGLGLAISRTLVESMGGLIGVSSETGEGSTFWVRLPRVDAPAAATRAA